MVGIERSQGGAGNPPVLLGKLAPADYTAGALGALGAVLALFERARTGLSQRVDTNLLNAGILAHSETFMRYEGSPRRRPADMRRNGLSALYRMYETEDGWIYLAMEADAEWSALCGTLAPNELSKNARFASADARHKNDAALARELARIFRRRSSEEWLQILEAEGVPCAPIVDGHDHGFYSDDHAVANDMVVEHRHPSLGWFRASCNYIRFGSTSKIDARPTPLLGQHTREVLGELGYSPLRIDELYEMGVVKTEEPRVVDL